MKLGGTKGRTRSSLKLDLVAAWFFRQRSRVLDPCGPGGLRSMKLERDEEVRDSTRGEERKEHEAEEKRRKTGRDGR